MSWVQELDEGIGPSNKQFQIQQKHGFHMCSFSYSEKGGPNLDKSFEDWIAILAPDLDTRIPVTRLDLQPGTR